MVTPSEVFDYKKDTVDGVTGLLFFFFVKNKYNDEYLFARKSSPHVVDYVTPLSSYVPLGLTKNFEAFSNTELHEVMYSSFIKSYRGNEVDFSFQPMTTEKLQLFGMDSKGQRMSDVLPWGLPNVNTRSIYFKTIVSNPTSLTIYESLNVMDEIHTEVDSTLTVMDIGKGLGSSSFMNPLHIALALQAFSAGDIFINVKR